MKAHSSGSTNQSKEWASRQAHAMWVCHKTRFALGTGSSLYLKAVGKCLPHSARGWGPEHCRQTPTSHCEELLQGSLLPCTSILVFASLISPSEALESPQPERNSHSGQKPLEHPEMCSPGALGSVSCSLQLCFAVCLDLRGLHEVKMEAGGGFLRTLSSWKGERLGEQVGLAWLGRSRGGHNSANTSSGVPRYG